MTDLQHPNGELVAQAWLAAYAGFPSGQLAGSIPDPVKSPWPGNGFVLVRALVGGGVDATLPERRVSILQVDFLGTRSTHDTFRPLWGVAMDLAECVRVATFAGVQGYGKSLDMPVAGYRPARALAAYLLTEPVRVEDDPSGYARMTTNLSLAWTV
jgi:hypothetical protein